MSEAPPPPSPKRSERPRPTIAELGLLIAGIAVAFALFADAIKEQWERERGYGIFAGLGEWSIVLIVTVLGGLSFVGAPLLLWERRRGPRRRWGPGRFQWFTTGAAAWLLWPPVVVRRAQGDDGGVAEICYFYGTPLMAAYVTLALIAGRWWRPMRRRKRNDRGKRASLPWRERFGLMLGAAWACVGVYVLWLIYRDR